MEDKKQINDSIIEIALEYANSIIATLREPFLVLDKKLRVVSVNRVFYDTFKVSEKDTLGQLLFDLGNGQWNIPKLLILLREILPEKKVIENYEIEQEFKHLGLRCMNLNACQLHVPKKIAMAIAVKVVAAAAAAAAEEEEELILLAIEDITERKRLQVELENSEDRYRRAFETSRDGLLLIHKTEGSILNSNKSVQELLGYSQDELLKKKIWEIGITKGHNDFQEVLSILERDGVFSYEYIVLKSKEGVGIDSEIFLVDKASVMQCNIRNITEHRKIQESLRNIEWMLTKSAQPKSLKKQSSLQSYGDITKCNISRLVLDSVGEEVLFDIADDFLDLLDTCTAIYEKNGDYAYGIFASHWCKFMDEASRNLCGTQDNKEALASGKWICHESCWNEASKVSIETARPVDIKCKGGIHIYAVPIYSGKEIVGSINFGYGNPPKDPRKIKELASLYGVKEEKLFELAGSYESRPAYIIEIARKRLAVAAKRIGSLVERKKLEQEMNKRLRELEVFYKASVGREERILELKNEIEELKKRVEKGC